MYFKVNVLRDKVWIMWRKEGRTLKKEPCRPAKNAKKRKKQKLY